MPPCILHASPCQLHASFACSPHASAGVCTLAPSLATKPPHPRREPQRSVNFDADRMRDYCLRVDQLTRDLKKQLAAKGVAGGPAAEPMPW